ncbi:MAG TPA: hypothetical protein VIU93_01970 [Gallionellaceae bacterium]
MTSVRRMGKPLSSTVTALLAIALCHSAGAATPAAGTQQDAAAGAYAFVSHDSEGFNTQAAGLEYLPEFRHGNALTGVRYTYRTYTQQGWRRDAQQVTLIRREIDPATYNGWQLDAGLSEQGGHGLLTLDGGYHQPLAEKTGLDLFVDREWVEARPALDAGVYFTFLGGSIDHGLNDHWTVVGVTGRQDFSDGNSRDHYRARLVYQPVLDSGLTVQGRYRTYHSNMNNVGGTYFNPSDYDETMLALGWRTRSEGWVLMLTGGAGVQHINHAAGTNTRLLELSLESPYRGDQFIRLRGGYSLGASFGGPDYEYTYVQAEWIVRL